MEAIRILLAEVPTMLREIIQSVVEGQADMSIVGAIPSRDPVIAALENTPADVVIVGLRKAEATDAFDSLLFEQPRLKLLAISGDGGSSYLYELRPHCVPLGDVSPNGLVEAIRTMASSGAR